MLNTVQSVPSGKSALGGKTFLLIISLIIFSVVVPLTLFSQDDEENKTEVKDEKESKYEMKIISPKKNERIIKNTRLEIKWEYVSKETDASDKKDEKEKTSKIKIELSDGTVIKDAVESKHNSKTAYDWYIDKDPKIYTIKISDSDNDGIKDEVDFEVVNAIDVFLPNKEDEIKGGSRIIVGWTANYDRKIDTDKLKLEFSDDGGNNWKAVDTKDSIEVKGHSYIFRMDAPNDIGNKTCKFRVTDETNQSDKKQNVSDAFKGSRPSSSNYTLRFGGDFDFFEGVKISDLHTTASIYIPEMTKTFGLNLYLGRSRGHGQDTSSLQGPFTDSTIKSVSTSKKSDVVNIALGAGLLAFTSKLKPFYLMPLYFEFRRGLKETKSNNETIKTNGAIDTTIKNEVTDKKTVDEWLLGSGFGLNLKHKFFELSGYCVVAYNTTSKRSDPERNTFLERCDVLLRFDLMETGADISFGCELRYPFVYTPNTPAELTFYLTKDISLSSLYNDLFGRSSK